MTQPLPSETIEYERYVDGLRKSNAQLVEAAKFTTEVFEHSGCEKNVCPICDLKAAIAQANGVALKKTITIHIEGGLVQDVTGIPAGYEVRVEDHDEGDTSNPSWDAVKQCFVTIYSGEAV